LTTIAVGALLAAGWRTQWNRAWRFSQAKAGLWLLLLQLGIGATALWRLRPAAAGTTLASAAVLIVLQAGGWAFFMAFLSGRNQLFGMRTLTLVHVSPAPLLAPVVAAAFFGILRRCWSMLIWAVALGTVAGPWAVPILWILGVVAATLGHLAGLLILIAWVRLAPRALSVTWVAILVLQVVLIWFLVYQVAVGVTPGSLAVALRVLRGPLVSALAALFGLPGLAMLLWLGIAPARLGQAYRDGWLRLSELADGAARPRRSAWPRLAPGAAGVVQAKEWLLAARNPATWFRLGALVLLGLTLFPARPAIERLAAGHLYLVVLGAGLGAVYFAFGELLAAGFSAEGPRLGLLIIAGVSPARLLAGKLLALTPYALLSAVSTWAVSVAVGGSLLQHLAAALATGGVALGLIAVSVGGAACDVKISEAEEEHELAALSTLMEQIPRGFGGNAGMIGSAVWAGCCAWAYSASSPWFLALLGPVPALVLLLGWWRLGRKLRAFE